MSDAAGRHAETIAALRRAVLMTPGALSVDERAAAESAAPTGTVADAYLEKVRHASYRIIDADIDSLTTAGMTEDAILELSLAAALGEATRGFDRSIRALLAAPASAAAHPPSGVVDAEA
jgi:alkylhydroperoxidase family enzyme